MVVATATSLKCRVKKLTNIIEKFMKTRKPRNHVQLALMKRGGAGSHKKTHKQLRGQWKRNMDV